MKQRDTSMLLKKIEKKKKMFLKALHENRGNISYACSATDIGRTHYYRWIKEDAEFKEAVLNVKEYNIDHVESKLHEKIDEGDITAIIFYLKTQGKGRGYVERQDIDIGIRKIGIDAEESYE